MMTARCVLIGPDDSLDLLEAAPEMFRRQADPYNGDTSEFVIHRATVSSVGMRGLAACAAVLATDRYPPNHLAGRLVRGLGGPDRYWFGRMILCGYRLENGGETVLCGLDDSQCRLITDVLRSGGRPRPRPGENVLVRWLLDRVTVSHSPW
ncbi:hypothetical protein ACH4YO_29300 [Streptomyces noursei]|uniref:hypothetical protein n=1 Tax=Streptomyces noursei TaxID=1971 RepID=UPI0037A940D5